MASLVPHSAPSVGAVVKKITEINPNLGTQEIIALIRESLQAQGGNGNEFASAEVLDEDKALRLARATLERRAL
jgi:hypothetical protein